MNRTTKINYIVMRRTPVFRDAVSTPIPKMPCGDGSDQVMVGDGRVLNKQRSKLIRSSTIRSLPIWWRQPTVYA
jgi:hypothetical protein